TTTSIPTAPTSSMPPCGATGPASRMAHCSRVMPASGPRPYRRGRQPRTSSCRDRPVMASPASSTSSASNRPASRPRWRWPSRCATSRSHERRDMTLARRGLFAGLAGLLGGCSPATLLNATVSRQGYTREADIAYGPDPRQKLDFYQPDKPRAAGKTVIFFYGGAWESGSKNYYLFVAQALASSGYAVVIPDYRLYPAVRFPAFVDDGARAVRWTADRVGSDKVFIMGHSAGAHIALLLAANTPYLAAAGVDRMKLKGAIGLAGPYDFLPLKSARLIEIFGGANNPDIEAITFARSPLPPALLDRKSVV